MNLLETIWMQNENNEKFDRNIYIEESIVLKAMSDRKHSIVRATPIFTEMCSIKSSGSSYAGSVMVFTQKEDIEQSSFVSFIEELVRDEMVVLRDIENENLEDCFDFTTCGG